MTPLRIGIVGFGKIARDQHVPAIAGEDRFSLAAIVSPRAPGPEGVPCFADTDEMLASMPDLDAVAICTPPAVRYDIARTCLERGRHCLLEKPPGVTLGEVDALVRLAEDRGACLFATWHARHNPAVAEAADRLAGRRIESMRIVWHEDVRKWHPGQQWIWQPGGFGVFDPGINAFSIATRIVPGPLLVRSAELLFPENRAMPIAAELDLESPAIQGPASCSLAWRHRGDESWTIELTSDGQRLVLSGGGSRLAIDGEVVSAQGPGEYPSLYARFAELIEQGGSDVDAAPLRVAADAFMAGRRTIVEPFED